MFSVVVQKSRYIKFLFFLALVASPFVNMGQTLGFHGHLGYGSFWMTQMNGFVDYFQESNSEIPTKKTDAFPSYWISSFGFHSSFSNLEFGTNTSLMSSGARLAYSDFSGAYIFYVPVRALSNGVYCSYFFDSPKPFLFGVSLESGIINSSVKFEEYIEVYEESESYKNNAKSLNVYLSPSIQPQLLMKNLITLGFSIGYQIDIVKTPLIDGKQTYYDQNNDELLLDWSGFRFGTFLKVRILK